MNRVQEILIAVLLFLVDYSAPTSIVVHAGLIVLMFFWLGFTKGLIFLHLFVAKSDRNFLFHSILGRDLQYFTAHDFDLLGINVFFLLTALVVLVKSLISRRFSVNTASSYFGLSFFAILFISSILNLFDFFSIKVALQDVYFWVYSVLLSMLISYKFTESKKLLHFCRNIVVIFLLRGLLFILYDLYLHVTIPGHLVEAGIVLPLFVLTNNAGRPYSVIFRSLLFLSFFVITSRGVILILLYFLIVFFFRLKVAQKFLFTLGIFVVCGIFYFYLLPTYFPSFFQVLSFKAQFFHEIYTGSLSHSPAVRLYESRIILEETFQDLIHFFVGQGPGGYIEGVDKYLQLNVDDYSIEELNTKRFHFVHFFMNNVFLKGGVLGLILYLVVPMKLIKNSNRRSLRIASIYFYFPLIYGLFWRLDLMVVFALLSQIKLNDDEEELSLYLER